MESVIRWKRGDYITLGKAVSQFNKRIRELQNEENRLYLPDEIDYKEIKGQIVTRKNLNKVIKNLKKFQEEGQERAITLKGGEKLTIWEYNELKEKQEFAINKLKEEQKGFNKVERPYMTARELEIEGQLSNLVGFEGMTGGKFKKYKSRIKKVGTQDYEMRKAMIYQDNYLNTLEKYKGFSNYEVLIKKLRTIKNPKKFYNFLKNTNNENIIDLTYVSDQDMLEKEFNKFVQEILGEDVEVVDTE